MNQELKKLIESFENLDLTGQVKTIKILRELDATDTYDKIHQWFLNAKDGKVRNEALKTLKRFKEKIWADQRKDAQYSAKIANRGRMDCINPLKPPYGSGRTQ